MVNVTASVSRPSLSYYLNYEPGNASIGANINTQIVMVMPINYGKPFPGDITANTVEFLVPGGAGTTTGSFGFTLSAALYSLNNSTRLTIVNSLSLAFTRPAEATAVRAPLINGLRWLTGGTAAWSSNPAFSEGVQYWMVVRCNSAVTANIGGFVAARAVVWDAASIFAGDLNVASASGSNWAPFWGFISTGGIPVSIGTANLTTFSAANNSSGASPIFALRNIVRN